MQELLRLGLPAEHDVGSLCVCARSWDKGITWLCLDVSMPSATDVGELTARDFELTARDFLVTRSSKALVIKKK